MIVGIVGANNFLDTGIAIVIVIISYIAYLCMGYNCSQARKYLKNMKEFAEYKEIYENMVREEGYLRFHIRCYHYERKRRTPVITHRATYKYIPKKSEDDSGDLTGIRDLTSYVFVNYQKGFYFANEASAKAYDRAYKHFVAKNKSDHYQSHSSTL